MGLGPQEPKICVVTPYYKEGREWLERCLASVSNQTVKADHIMVADGFPQLWLDEAGVRHVKLDRAHADYGDVARGRGALMAINEKYQAIAFLDADNCFAHDHIETCLAAAAANPNAPYVVARRDLVRPDGSVLPITMSADFPFGDHVDTNCYLFLPPAFSLLHYWVTIPKEFSIIGDRLFRIVMKSRLAAPAVAFKPTVKYTCLAEVYYKAAGEAPPEGADKPNVNLGPAIEWLRMQLPEELVVIDELSGMALSRLASAAA